MTTGKDETDYYKEIGALNREHGVFLVRDERTGAVRVKKEQQTFNSDVYRRIKASDIKGIPRIYAMHEEDGLLTLIEEYIPGETLENMLKNYGAMKADDVQRIASKICDILTTLHEMIPPIIHRDIKPSNIIITPAKEVYLLDLNAAKLEDSEETEDTVLLGTYGYAAPEQYGFGASTVQTDIYALGMLMNTLLRGEYSKEIIKDSPLSEIIEKCVMLQPEDRYPSAAGLKSALRSPGGITLHQLIPPGFRSGNPMHMFIAVLGYALIASLTLTLTTDHPTGVFLTWYERVGCFVMVLALVFFASDYMGVQKKVPLCRSKIPMLRAMGILVTVCILFFLFITILAAGEILLAGTFGL